MTIALPHIILLSFYLAVLIYCIYKDSTWGYYVVAGLICIEIFWTVKFGVGDMVSHAIGDIAILSILCLMYFLIQNVKIKIPLMLLGYLGFFGFHVQFAKTEPLAEDNTLYEVFVQFDNKENLKNWIRTNEDTYNITYPLFRPADNSFLLDEYLLISDLDREKYQYFSAINSKNFGIEHIEINDVVELVTPELAEIGTVKNTQRLNDPHLNKQWMADPYKLDKFHKLTEQKKFQAAGTESLIAILDTGVDSGHEDLKGNYISISRRYDSDTRGHGTHCAGIAAAVTGNKIGIASLIPAKAPVKVTSIKVLNNFGAGTQKTIIDGIILAADKGCSVISLSLGGPTSDSKEKAYTEAVKYAQSKGSIVVVAAGNSGRDAKSYTPANTPGVIVVTALDSLMRKASFGNDVSSLGMGLAAPGTGIYSTFPKNQYKPFNGTSMAAPFISGLVGLMKAYDPTLTTEEVYKLIYDSAQKKNKLIIADPYSAMEQLFHTRLEG